MNMREDPSAMSRSGGVARTDSRWPVAVALHVLRKFVAVVGETKQLQGRSRRGLGAVVVDVLAADEPCAAV